MSKIDEITNEDIVEFYKTKKNSYPKTKCFMDDYVIKEGKIKKQDSYIDMFLTFIKQGSKGKKEDIEYYSYLVNKLESTIFNKENKCVQFALPKKENELNQKWHCLIAYFGFLEFKNEFSKKNIFSKSNKCPELRLWLYEGALYDGDCITPENSLKVKELYDRAIKYNENKTENLLYWNEKWSDESGGYVKDIIDVIKEFKKEKSIENDAVVQE